MKKTTILTLFISFFASIALYAQNKPKSELFRTIAHMDSVYFNAYNSCDMETQARIYSDSIEFYHDESGLETFKKNLLNAIKENICGKVSRELIPGSMEVYPLPGYGAVEIALHRFINHAEHDHVSEPSRFIVIWRHRDGKWQITRVISTHAGNSAN
jgi:hypothetical protein